VIDRGERLALLQGSLRVLQTAAGGAQVIRHGLLGERLLRECLNLRPGLIELIAVRRSRRASRHCERDDTKSNDVSHKWIPVASHWGFVCGSGGDESGAGAGRAGEAGGYAPLSINRGSP
jgi:hypothetical protein